MKKALVFIKQFISSIFEETEEEKKLRQDVVNLRKECENFRYCRPLLTDEQLKDLQKRVMTQKINEYACLVQMPAVNPHFLFDSLNIFSSIYAENEENSWHKYYEEISAEIENRRMY